MKIKNIISKANKNKFDIASNPEFLKEGKAVLDFQKPDRIVAGVENDKAFAIIEKIYEPLTNKSKKNILLRMSIASAELTKYVANAMLATRISFMNEVSIFAEKVNANVKEVQRGLSFDKRIGGDFLNPGLGYGGSCFPKDIKSILHQAKEKSVSLNVISGTKKSNQQQREFFFSKIENYFQAKLEKKVFTIWGLSFKPDTDDIRESISLYLIKELLKRKAVVKVHDPKAQRFVENIFKNKIHYFSDKYEALDNSHALILATEWEEYLSPNQAIMKKKMDTKVIFDGRNVLQNFSKQNNFKYFGVGLN